MNENGPSVLFPMGFSAPSRIITGLKNGRIKQVLFCIWKHTVQLPLFCLIHTGCSITGASHKAFLCVCIVTFTGHYLWARCSLRPSDAKTIENHLRQSRSRAHWSCVNISSISFYKWIELSIHDL